MSKQPPTLDEYFNSVRRDTTEVPDTARSLLQQYRGKALARYKRRILRASAGGAALAVITGGILLCGLPSSPLYHNASVEDLHSMIDGGAPTPPATVIDGSAGGGTHASPSSPLSVPDSPPPQTNTRERATAQNIRPVPLHDKRPLTVHASLRPASQRLPLQHTAITRTETSPFPVSTPATDFHREVLSCAVVQPALMPTHPAFASAALTEPLSGSPDETQVNEDKTFGLRIGFSYGSMQPEISAINRELALIDYTPLSTSFRQYSLHVAALLGSFSVGAEYNIPSSASSELARDSYPTRSPQSLTDVPVISYDQNRWSLFASYTVPVTDNFSIDAGAMMSFTSYTLSFTKQGAEFPYDPGLSSTDDWTTLWAAAAGNGRVVRMNYGKEAITSHATGIGPEVGINWQALNFLKLHARLRYLINFDHNWYNSTSNDKVDGVNAILKMNEYSVQLGASFSQWMF